MGELNLNPQEMSETEAYNFKIALEYANAQIRRLRDVNKSETSVETITFSGATKEDLIAYLQAPKRNEKKIRDISIAMYHSSTHYKRLLLYYALMPVWSYVLKPLNYNVSNKKEKQLKSAYQKAADKVAMMNLKHEMQKAMIIGLREGIFYGVIWESTSGNSFTIQRINPDWCQLSSIEDGTWIFAVDMSRIKEEELYRYPKEFEAMYRKYINGEGKWQEVPSKICFCFKADETCVEYSLPPWASTMPLILDVENYKGLQETASEIANYKLLSMRIPLDEHNAPKFNFELAVQYYNMLTAELPPFVGAVMSPMQIEDFNFNKDGSLNNTDIVSRAERQFWQDSGSSSLLFGDAANTTAGALKLSIKADEEIVFAWMNQLERIVNRILKTIPGTSKFGISFLPVTNFNLGEMIGYYKDAATLGIPVKSAYSSVLGVSMTEIPGLDYTEREILGMDELMPLSSSYNSSSDEAGRPQKNDEDLTDSGTRMREDNNNV
ncbi:MAG: hypothetical protein J6T96_05195 [Bacteroidales bacterium]|nr:hypothetical protein [Bacteroidales bacterium]